MQKENVLMATGGTGGHVFPAFALGQELEKQGYEVKYILDDRTRKFAKIDGEKFFIVNSRSLSGNFSNKLISLAFLCFSIIQSIYLIWKLKPDVVIGFGGYPSFAPCVAAFLLGKKYIIHEQNSVLGKANAFLAKFAYKLAISFPKTKFVTPNLEEKTIYTGNFVREEVKRVKPLEKFSNSTPLNIFIIGGSLGASIFGRIIPDAIISLPKEYRKKVNIVQQALKNEVEELSQKYKDNNINAQVDYFFNNVECEYEKAHLVIARAGATTIAELHEVKRPAILVPIAKSNNNHQFLNAVSLSSQGVAILLQENHDFSVENVANQIKNMIDNEEIINNMIKQYKNVEQPTQQMII
jgi:UDP-N-acetylglucosamine--N-acetylmuramyl-(pentapeptide) pyrophosphoryl-undecaprenol N-acetylglucosamine transferase